MVASVSFAIAEVVAPPPPPPPPPSVSVQSDGFLWHSPSNLRLPREIAGPTRTHIATLTAITPDKVELIYGPITVTIGQPTAAADPVMVPPGWKADPDAPALPGLLFWGEGAEPMTISFLHGDGAAPQDWLSFSVVASGWQIEMSALYAPENRETVIRTAEAVWALLASANAEPPKPPPGP